MKRKLLVIDEEQFDRDVMEKIFGSTYSIAFAINAENSVSVITSFKPGVIFFELRKADINQLEIVFDTMEKNSPDSNLIISASENTRELEKYARSRNVFYYMLRPFNLKELWDAIEWGFRKDL